MIDTGDESIINNVINSWARENERLFDQLYQIQYYFRGALTRDDVWAMVPLEREKSVEFLNNRFTEVGEMMKKQIPVFY